MVKTVDTALGDTDLLELMEILGPENPSNPREPITEDAFDDIMRELADPDMWKSNQEIVEKNLMKYIDDPQVPTGTEKMGMLDQLSGNVKWYDRWVAERTESAAKYYETADSGTGNIEMMDLAKGKVQEAFKMLEGPLDNPGQRSLAEFVLDEGGITPYCVSRGIKPDWVQNIPNIGHDIDAFDFEGGTEMINLDLTSLEMPYFSVDGGMAPISGATLEGMGGTAELDWSLFPTTVGEISEVAMGAVAGAVGGAVVATLVYEFTTVGKNLSTALNYDWKSTGTLSQEAAQMSGRMATMYSMNPYLAATQKVAQYLKTSPQYVWVFDDGPVSSPSITDGQSYGNDLQVMLMSHPLPGTNLWVRGRIVDVIGTNLGFDNAGYPILICIKPGSDAPIPMLFDAGEVLFWINPATARVLKDTIAVTRGCLKSNLAKKAFREMNPEYPWGSPVTKSAWGGWDIAHPHTVWGIQQEYVEMNKSTGPKGRPQARLGVVQARYGTKKFRRQNRQGVQALKHRRKKWIKDAILDRVLSWKFGGFHTRYPLDRMKKEAALIRESRRKGAPVLRTDFVAKGAYDILDENDPWLLSQDGYGFDYFADTPAWLDAQGNPVPAYVSSATFEEMEQAEGYTPWSADSDYIEWGNMEEVANAEKAAEPPALDVPDSVEPDTTAMKRHKYLANIQRFLYEGTSIPPPLFDEFNAADYTTDFDILEGSTGHRTLDGRTDTNGNMLHVNQCVKHVLEGWFGVIVNFQAEPHDDVSWVAFVNVYFDDGSQDDNSQTVVETYFLEPELHPPWGWVDSDGNFHEPLTATLAPAYVPPQKAAPVEEVPVVEEPEVWDPVVEEPEVETVQVWFDSTKKDEDPTAPEPTPASIEEYDMLGLTAAEYEACFTNRWFYLPNHHRRLVEQDLVDTFPELYGESKAKMQYPMSQLARENNEDLYDINWRSAHDYFYTLPGPYNLGVNDMNLFEFVWQWYRFEDAHVDEYRWWPKKGVPATRLLSESWKHDISYTVYMKDSLRSAARKKYGKEQSRATPKSLEIDEMDDETDQPPKLVDFPLGYPRPSLPDEPEYTRHGKEYYWGGDRGLPNYLHDKKNFYEEDADNLRFMINNVLLRPTQDRYFLQLEEATVRQLLIRAAELDLSAPLLIRSDSLHRRQAYAELLAIGREYTRRYPAFDWNHRWRAPFAGKPDNHRPQTVREFETIVSYIDKPEEEDATESDDIIDPGEQPVSKEPLATDQYRMGSGNKKLTQEFIKTLTPWDNNEKLEKNQRGVVKVWRDPVTIEAIGNLEVYGRSKRGAFNKYYKSMLYVWREFQVIKVSRKVHGAWYTPIEIVADPLDVKIVFTKGYSFALDPDIFSIYVFPDDMGAQRKKPEGTASYDAFTGIDPEESDPEEHIPEMPSPFDAGGLPDDTGSFVSDVDTESTAVPVGERVKGMARGKGQQPSLEEPPSLDASMIDWAVSNPEFDTLSQTVSTVKQERLEKAGYEFSIAESSEETPVLPERLFSPTEAQDLPEMPIEQLQSVIDKPVSLEEGVTYYDASPFCPVDTSTLAPPPLEGAPGTVPVPVTEKEKGGGAVGMIILAAFLLTWATLN